MKRYTLILAILILGCRSWSIDFPTYNLSTSTAAFTGGTIPQDWTNSTVVTYSWDTRGTASLAGMYVVYAMYPLYWTSTSYQVPLATPFAIITVASNVNSVTIPIAVNVPFIFYVRAYNISSTLWSQSNGSNWVQATFEIPNSIIPSISSTQGDSTNLCFTFSTSTNICPIVFQTITLDTTTTYPPNRWLSFYSTYRYAVPSSGTFLIYSRVRNIALTSSLWSCNTVTVNPIYAIKPKAPYLTH